MSENIGQDRSQIGPGTGRAEQTPETVGTGTAGPTPHKNKKRRYKPRARACKWCGKVFTPARSHARYCCALHRYKAFEQRQRRKPKPPKEVILVEMQCQHCQRSYLAPRPTVSTRKYCSIRCQERARRQRKRAAPQALAAAMNVPVEMCFDVVERAGLALVTGALAGLGLVWTGREFALEVQLPITAPAAFVQQLHQRIDQLVSIDA